MKKQNDLTFKETLGKNNKFSNKGITLIALVITIIVLLILAGVTIVALTGNNNLFKRAEQAEEETKKGEATEKINLKITNMQISSYTENQQMPTLQYLADGFCKDKEIEYVDLKTKKYASVQIAQTEGEFLLPQIDAKNAESIFVKLIEYPYEFEINKSLQLVSIDNTKIATNTDTTEKNYSVNNYTKWPENTEINLGDNVYGYRFTGKATGTGYQCDYKCMDTGERPHIIDYGGQIDVSSQDSNKISAQGYMWTTSEYLIPTIVSLPNVIRLQVSMQGEHNGGSYDIWVTYTK